MEPIGLLMEGLAPVFCIVETLVHETSRSGRKDEIGERKLYGDNRMTREVFRVELATSKEIYRQTE